MHTSNLHHSLLVAVFASLVALAIPSFALADEPASGAAEPVPEHRVDLVIPSLGIGHFTAPTSGYQQTILTLAVDLRYAHRSGHGVMARYAVGTNGWGGGHGGDLDYLYRIALGGDRHVSTSLDAMIGPTLAVLDHNEGLLPVGLHYGGNAALSLDFRARNFVLALGTQYRLLVPTERAINGGPTGVQHAITATLGFGFTFY